MAPRFAFSPVDADPGRTLYVDGTEAGFRSLSHWPGNATPSALKRDLSTGIALAWAACSPAEREALTGPFEVVANNHYDTDGVLSVYGVLRPEEALEHEDLLLRAAATGDFARWTGRDALAVELALMGLTTDSGAPLAHLSGASDRERHEAAYLWALDHMDEVLRAGEAREPPFAARLAVLEDQLRRVDARDGVAVEELRALDLAVVATTAPLSRLALVQAAGARSRVLLVHDGADGPRYRLVFRVESWFELVTDVPPPRRPLEPAVEALDAAEQAARGASAADDPAAPRWWSGALAQPVCQLGFGDRKAAGDGFSRDTDLSGDPPSRLGRAAVLEALEPVLAV